MALPHRDSDPRKAPKGWEKWMSTIVAGIFIGLVAAEILVNYEPRKLGAVFLLMAWVPLLFIHEAGHAIMAWLCGWHVERVVLGFGHRMRKFHIGSTLVDVRAVPIEGFVLPVPKNLKSPRLKSTLIYAGGPLAEILVVLLLVLIFGWDRLTTTTDELGMLAVQATCVAALIGLFITLVPHSTKTGGGISWSDGMGIILSHKLPDKYFREMIEGAKKKTKHAEEKTI